MEVRREERIRVVVLEHLLVEEHRRVLRLWKHWRMHIVRRAVGLMLVLLLLLLPAVRTTQHAVGRVWREGEIDRGTLRM